ncbi:MAG: hypothetical protein J0I69_02765 [Altererythrobacter sp.]|nr:hypothetical protein [Altererythrobacter sp.]OJU60941.1 MAG: hypothetical protein BGO08_12510 [Altererythrobacter sp. 66-12]
MTKRSSAAKTPAAAKAKPGSAKQASETTEIPAASGAEGKPESAAAPDGGTTAKVWDPRGADAADPAGTGGAPAAQPEETREQAEAASADRKDAAEEGKEPEETARPPVAGGFTPAFIVTGPAEGFRRGGITFDRQPRELTPADFGVETEGAEMEPEQARRLLAILEEPRLTVVARVADDGEAPVAPEVIAFFRAAIAKQTADA